MNTITRKKLLQITVQSQYKNLFRAVLRQGEFDFQNLQDIYNHGIDGGFYGFIYYSDTTAFFKRNRNAILELAKENADHFRLPVCVFIAGFNCLKSLTVYDVEYALISPNHTVTVQNALDWFAAEECAHFIVESIEG